MAQCVSVEAVSRFLATETSCGLGSGSGLSLGWGDGLGDGSGSGWGDGLGQGNGSGDGSGSGSGLGDGLGWGEFWGRGWGPSNGSGEGSYDGVSAFAGKAVNIIDNIQTIIHSIHGNVASGEILHSDLTTEKCYIVKGGGFFAHGKTIPEAMAALEEKIVDNMPVEEKIEKFMEVFIPGTKYPAMDFYKWHNTLTGSCEMGRNAFAKDHGIDVENGWMTPEEFIALTENAYGGSVIRKLKEAMEAEP